MENFTLFNLLKALGGMGTADSGAADTAGEARGGNACPPRADGAGTVNAGRANSGQNCTDSGRGGQNCTDSGRGGQNGDTRGAGAPPPPRDGQTNVLAAVLERHEKIANRIRRPSADGR